MWIQKKKSDFPFGCYCRFLLKVCSVGAPVNFLMSNLSYLHCDTGLSDETFVVYYSNLGTFHKNLF